MKITNARLKSLQAMLAFVSTDETRYVAECALDSLRKQLLGFNEAVKLGAE